MDKIVKIILIILTLCILTGVCFRKKENFAKNKISKKKCKNLGRKFKNGKCTNKCLNKNFKFNKSKNKCIMKKKKKKTKQQMIRYGIYYDPETFNWFKNISKTKEFNSSIMMSKQTISLYIYDYILKRYIPQIVTPEIVVNNKKEKYVVELELISTFRWSDNILITVDDVIIGFEILKKLNYNEYKIGLIDKITKSKTLNKFLIYLKKPLSNYILISEILAKLPCVHNKYWKKFKTIEDILSEKAGIEAPVASPFTYDSIVKGGFYTWVKKPDTMWNNIETTYYGDESNIVGKSIKYKNATPNAFTVNYGNIKGKKAITMITNPVDLIEFSLYGDRDAAYEAFTNGYIDHVIDPLRLKELHIDNSMLNSLNYKDIKTKLNMNKKQYYNMMYRDSLNYFAFNLKKFPCNNKAFRKAIARMIDSSSIINKVVNRKLTEPIYDLDFYNSLNHTDTNILKENRSLNEIERWEKAIKILKDGGWTATNWGKVVETTIIAPTGLTGPKGETISEMKFLFPNYMTDPIRYTFGLIISDYINKLGFNCKAISTDINTIVSTFDPKYTDWHFYILGLEIYSRDLRQYTDFITSSEIVPNDNNSTSFSNKEFDRIADKLYSKDEEQLITHASKLQAILNEELPYIPLFAYIKSSLFLQELKLNWTVFSSLDIEDYFKFLDQSEIINMYNLYGIKK